MKFMYENIPSQQWVFSDGYDFWSAAPKGRTKSFQ